jgi:hypothetical protein
MSMELPPSTTPISESDSSLAYSAKVQETCDDIAVAANPKQVALDSARKRLRLLPASRTFLEEILPVLLNGNDEERAAAKERYEHFETELLNSHETETHVGLMESFEPRYQGMALELCETAAEKATAELAANAFVRAIACSRKFNRLSEEYWLTGKEQTTHMAMYSKQIDRSYRQYASAISLLSQLKSPRPEIIIRTNNAFVAQSQQINAGTPPA